MSRIVFNAKHATETVSAVFDFASILGIGETISSASAASVVYSGVSTTALTLSAATHAGTQVTVLIGAGTLGVVYLITVSVNTLSGQLRTLEAFMPVVPNAN